MCVQRCVQTARHRPAKPVGKVLAASRTHPKAWPDGRRRTETRTAGSIQPGEAGGRCLHPRRGGEELRYYGSSDGNQAKRPAEKYSYYVIKTRPPLSFFCPGREKRQYRWSIRPPQHRRATGPTIPGARQHCPRAACPAMYKQSQRGRRHGHRSRKPARQHHLSCLCPRRSTAVAAAPFACCLGARLRAGGVHWGQGRTKSRMLRAQRTIGLVANLLTGCHS